MKTNLAFLVLIICEMNTSTLLSQINRERYVLEKTVTVPIGHERGEIKLGYLALGRWVDLPDVIAVDYKGNFIIGSRLQKDAVQKFDNDGRYIVTIATRGPADGNVLYPYKIGIDSTNAVYILDAEKFIEPGAVSQSYSIKKLDPLGRLTYKIDYKTTQSEPIMNGGVQDLWVTPGGEVYFKDRYSPRWPGTSTEAVYGIDASGKLAGKVDRPFLVNHKGEVIEVDQQQDQEDNFNYVINKYQVPVERKEVKELITSREQLNKIRSFKIEGIKYMDQFLGFDQSANLYFGKRYEVQQKEGKRVSVESKTVYKFSADGELLAKIDLPTVKGYSQFFVDHEGNIYQVHVVYTTHKRYTEGDHLEIAKWTPRK